MAMNKCWAEGYYGKCPPSYPKWNCYMGTTDTTEYIEEPDEFLEGMEDVNRRVMNHFTAGCNNKRFDNKTRNLSRVPPHSKQVVEQIPYPHDMMAMQANGRAEHVADRGYTVETMLGQERTFVNYEFY